MDKLIIVGIIVLVFVAGILYVRRPRRSTSTVVRGNGWVMLHTHRWTRNGWLERVPLEDPPTYRHTTFQVQLCDCGAWSSFPYENRKLLSAGAAAKLAE